MLQKCEYSVQESAAAAGTQHTPHMLRRPGCHVGVVALATLSCKSIHSHPSLHRGLVWPELYGGVWRSKRECRVCQRQTSTEKWLQPVRYTRFLLHSTFAYTRTKRQVSNSAGSEASLLALFHSCHRDGACETDDVMFLSQTMNLHRLMLLL